MLKQHEWGRKAISHHPLPYAEVLSGHGMCVVDSFVFFSFPFVLYCSCPWSPFLFFSNKQCSFSACLCRNFLYFACECVWVFDVFVVCLLAACSLQGVCVDYILLAGHRIVCFGLGSASHSVSVIQSFCLLFTPYSSTPAHRRFK